MFKKAIPLSKDNELLYREKLPDLERSRYMEKISFIDNKDPLEPSVVKLWTRSCEDILPSIAYFDIVNYLVFSNSFYTKEQLKCYKGLDAYTQFVCGWVSDRAAYACSDNKHVVVSGKVLHSMKIREKGLRPWVAAEKGGNVTFCHCNCMAGCGEVCTHVAALLFSIEAVVRIRDARTVTDTAAYWKLPAEIKQIEHTRVSHIDFTSAKGLKKKLDKKLDCDTPLVVNKTSSTQHLNKIKSKSDKATPNNEELQSFYDALFETGTKPVVLSTIEPYCNSYIPGVISEIYPQILSELYDEKMVDSTDDDLLKKCQTVHIKVSEEQSKQVEAATRLQYRTKAWQRFRTARITASRAKAVCRTNPKSPSASLVKAICYPETKSFSTTATKWGCDHEETAKNSFIKQMEPFHEQIGVEQCGFFIDPENPYLGASPDGLVSCLCCGTALLEVKCPYCVKDCDLSEKKTDCLDKQDDGRLFLNRSHAYFYQVQTQLGVTKKDMCFFVVWTSKDLHVERIMFDSEVYNEVCVRSKFLFETAILPEIIGKYFTRRPVLKPVKKTVPQIAKPVLQSISVQPSTSSNVSVADTKWCYCHDEEHGDMIGCDNQNCKVQWFHYECVGISLAPKGKWYCKNCRPQKNGAKKNQI